MERLADEVASADSKVTVAAPPSLMGQWDAVRLGQVLTNLIENAVEYAPRAKLEVTLREEVGAARLEIRDFGPGIPPALLPSIFDRFERAGASRNIGGLGLGLFIAKQVIVSLCGTIVAEVPDGGGARFVIRLPLAS